MNYFEMKWRLSACRIQAGYSQAEVAQILGCSERNVYRNIQSGKLEAVEREVMIPTLKKFVTEEALEKYKAGRAS